MTITVHDLDKIGNDGKAAFILWLKDKRKSLTEVIGNVNVVQTMLEKRVLTLYDNIISANQDIRKHKKDIDRNLQLLHSWKEQVKEIEKIIGSVELTFHQKLSLDIIEKDQLNEQKE